MRSCLRLRWPRTNWPQPVPAQLLPPGAPPAVEGETGAEEQAEDDAEEEDVDAPTEGVSAAKARLPAGMGRLRSTVDKRVTPALQRSVAGVLEDQRDDLVNQHVQ